MVEHAIGEVETRGDAVQVDLSIDFHVRMLTPTLFDYSGVLLSYAQRVNMSVAAQDMRDDFRWSGYQKGLMLSSFYWGYAAGLVPSSLLVKLTGPKRMFGIRSEEV